MGFFEEIRNECLIRELQRELNTDVLLFGADGFTYFGNLQAIEDCRIAILTPAREAESSDVEILTPGGEVRFVDFARVDMWILVGKGTGVKRDPIDPPQAPLNGTRALGNDAEAVDGRQESHCLIRQLRRSIGDNVAITTLGGFLFQGTLADVADELAIMTVDEIFVPGTSSSISDSKLRSVVVNLEALTSVSGVSCC